jgi:diguanylate cyclase (GGDEF)-like protein
VHQTVDSYEFHCITAIPIEHGGILEIQVPVEELMIRDSLTRVYSRHLLEQVAARELALLQRMNAPYALIMVDLDHLKSVNDTRGHQAGDAALRAVGNEILRSTRTADCPGRFGGDEFCIFLPRTDKKNATVQAERILAAIRDIRLPDDLADLRLTASIGLYSTRETFDFTAAVASVDRQLYKAKATGRDRLVSS